MKIVFAVFFIAAALGQVSPGAGPPVDIVLLVEDSISATGLIRHTDFTKLHDGDRVAVMTFGNKTSLKLPLTDRRETMDAAIRKVDSGLSGSTGRLWDALARAVAVFDGPPDPARRRAVFVVFSAQDASKDNDARSLRPMLAKASVSLSAAVAQTAPRRFSSLDPQLPPGEPRGTKPVPPEVWPEGKPIDRTHVAQQSTVQAVSALALETGGIVLEREWDFARLADHARVLGK